MARGGWGRGRSRGSRNYERMANGQFAPKGQSVKTTVGRSGGFANPSKRQGRLQRKRATRRIVRKVLSNRDLQFAAVSAVSAVGIGAAVGGIGKMASRNAPLTGLGKALK